MGLDDSAQTRECHISSDLSQISGAYDSALERSKISERNQNGRK